MSAYDIFMLAILAAAVLFGLWKGLAWQVASLAAIFVSYIVAVNFSSVVAGYISAEEPWNRFLAMFILYIGTSLAIWIAFGFVRKSLDDLQLEGFDRQAGAILGAVKGGLLCIVITLFAVTLLGEKTRETVCQSRSGFYIAKAIDQLTAFVPGQYHDVVDPYINNFTQAMEEHATDEPGETFKGEFITRDPDSVDTSNQYTGTWTAPENESGFDLKAAAKKFLDTAGDQIDRK